MIRVHPEAVISLALSAAWFVLLMLAGFQVTSDQGKTILGVALCVIAALAVGFAALAYRRAGPFAVVCTIMSLIIGAVSLLLLLSVLT